MLTQPAPTDGHDADADTLLEVDETARRLGTTKDWLYRHADRLPFTVHLGPRQRQGMARFYELAEKHQFCPRTPEIVFA